VDDERRLCRELIDRIHGHCKRTGDVGIRRLVESDVTVADLHEFD
jgi:hypothetical protein